jgi:hypothetical protein
MSLLPTAYLAPMRLGYLERKKSTSIQKFREVLTSVAGQGQTLFLLVVEDNKYQFSL